MSEAHQRKSAWTWFAVILALGAASCSNPGPGNESTASSSQAVVLVQPKLIRGMLGGSPVPQPPSHWENVALAVPPNRAGCGTSGAAFFKPAGPTWLEDGYGMKQVWKTSLACLRGTSSQCDATVTIVGNTASDGVYHGESYERGSPKRQQLLYVGGNDARFARLLDDTLLLESQGMSVSSGGFEPRAVQAFYASTDCGQTWALRSVIDPKYDFATGAYHNRSILNGLDYPYLHVDPWRGTVYVIVGGSGDEFGHTLLLVSKDNARTWTLVTDPATGLSPIPFAKRRITTLASGEVVIFGCESDVPTLRIYNPGTNTIGFAGTIGTRCSRVTPAQIGATDPLRDANLSIQRVISGSEQRVRVMFPNLENNRQRVAYAEVTITGGSIGGVFPVNFIAPQSLAGSVLHADMIEPDYLDVSPNGSTNPSMIHWIESNQTNPLWGTTATPWARVFASEGISTFQLGPSFDRLVEQGDYLAGAFFFDNATKQAGFVTPWMPDSWAESPFGSLDQLYATTVVVNEPTLTNCPPSDGATPNVCTSTTCPCVEGQGDCSSTGCAAGLVCANGAGSNYGYLATTDVCVPSACNPNPSTPGSTGFCSTTCRCAATNGDCDSDAECLPGLVCGRNNGAGFGLGSNFDVCVPAHCTDWVRNGNESSPDRGGSCGNPTCPLPLYNSAAIVGATCRGTVNQGVCDTDKECQPPLVCSNSVCVCRGASANGGLEFCSASCKCSEGQGLCKSDSDCATGLVCTGSTGTSPDDVGGLYGMASKARDAAFSPETVPRSDLKVCLPSTCATQRKTPGPMSTPGHADFCTTQCRCARGFGHCASNAECLPGLVCAAGLGPNFGLGTETSVCVPSHCTNDVLDADETFKDCGGRDCGACDQPVSRWIGALSQPRPITMFRRTTGEWLEGSFTSAGAVKASTATRLSTPVYGDFNGDLVIDRGYFGTQFVYYNGDTTQSITTPVVSPSGFFPAVGRYNLDSTFDVGWWKTSNTTWFAHSAATGANVLPFPGYVWGQAGDIPVPGDYDGGSKNDYAFFRPSTGQWLVRNTDGSPLWVDGSGNPQVLGQAGDIPVLGDYNGDGKSDLAVYRPATPAVNGTFFILWKTTSVPTATTISGYGQYLDVPVGGDMNGDGRSDICVYRANNARWFCRNVDGSWGNSKVWGEPRPLWPPQ